jgi:outer membrane protein assembly factor BamB
MPRPSAIAASLLLFSLLALSTTARLGADDRWPQWRGPDGTGASSGNPPLEWSEEKNVAWKVDLPGLGSSTPVVWGDLLFLTAALDTGRGPDGEAGSADRSGRVPGNVHQWVVLAYDRRDGTERWRTVVAEGEPHEGSHPDATWASNSPVTDGEHLIAYFGSQGIFGLDLEGKVVWQRDFGEMLKRNAFGEGSSPALHGNRVVVQWDHEGDSFIAVLDKTTGEEKWRQQRDEQSSWSTPLVVEHDGRAQVITNATTNVRSYDLETGELLWYTSGMTVNVIPSPVAKDGIVYLTSGFRGYALLAIRLAGAKGDVTGSENVLWSYDQDTPYVASPLLYDDTLYFFKVLTNVLTAFDVEKGEPLYGPVRVEDVGTVYASPVGAAGRIYVLDRRGVTVVLDAGPEYRVLATNRLDDGFDASPVVVGEDLYLRGRESLYCLRAQ